MKIQTLVHSALLLSAVAACDSRPTDVRELPQASDATYKLSVGTWRTGDHVDEPFELLATSGEHQYQVLHADQCKDVSVGHTANELYVFYEFLALDGFLSELGDQFPPAQLCNLRYPDCRAKQDEFRRAGNLAEQICSYPG